jgi:peptide/nickel transport system permease protein
VPTTKQQQKLDTLHRGDDDVEVRTDMVTPPTPAEAPAIKTAAAPAVVAPVTIEGRSLWELVWSRIRRSTTAMVSLIVIVLLLSVAVFAPVLTKFEGQDPYTQHNSAEYLHQGGRLVKPDGTVGSRTQPNLPLAKYRRPSADHWLGLEPGLGRDLFARLAYGAQVSLGIALASTLITVVLGTLFGALAGYLGGKIDAVVSRTIDLLLAFPVILFTVALTPVIAQRLGSLGNSNLVPIFSLILILGFFGAPYLARIVRGQTIGLKEREFVEAARSLGATTSRIIFREIVPNVVPVVLVSATLAIPTNIIAEAALSFIGVGVRAPTPSWGQMLNQAVQDKFYTVYPLVVLVPGVALLITVLAFNLLGDAVGDALDPRAART